MTQVLKNNQAVRYALLGEAYFFPFVLPTHRGHVVQRVVGIVKAYLLAKWCVALGGYHVADALPLCVGRLLPFFGNHPLWCLHLPFAQHPAQPVQFRIFISLRVRYGLASGYG